MANRFRLLINTSPALHKAPRYWFRHRADPPDRQKLLLLLSVQRLQALPHRTLQNFRNILPAKAFLMQQLENADFLNLFLKLCNPLNYFALTITQHYIVEKGNYSRIIIFTIIIFPCLVSSSLKFNYWRLFIKTVSSIGSNQLIPLKFKSNLLIKYTFPHLYY